MANLQNNLINVDVSPNRLKQLHGLRKGCQYTQTALFKWTVSNAFISESVLDNFKKQSAATPAFLGQLALLIIGAVLTIVGVFRIILSLGRLCADRHRDPLAAYASYQSLLDANWQQSQQTLEAYNDNMFSNSSWAAMLMYVIEKLLYLVD